MIVGNGLIAKAFINFDKNDNSVCVLASGVSNSNCENIEEFNREKNIIINNIKLNKSSRFIYFGTCSVDDPERLNSKYVKHKLEMEKIVTEQEKFLIIRLPQIAGYTKNNNTLLNFLYNRITNGKEFELWSKAKRNIIDIEDVVKITTYIINNKKENNIINVANKRNNSIKEIVEKMEKTLNLKANYKLIDCGSEYKINTEYIYNISRKLKINFDKNYTDRKILKYYK